MAACPGATTYSDVTDPSHVRWLGATSQPPDDHFLALVTADQTFDVGTGPVTLTDSNMALVTLSTAGKPVGVVPFGLGSPLVYTAAGSQLGHLVIAGYANEGDEVGGGPLMSGAFATQIDPGGTHSWSQNLDITRSSSDMGLLFNVASHPAHGVALAGKGAWAKGQAGDFDGFVGRLALDGTELWHQNLSPLHDIDGVAIGPSGEVVVTGVAQGDLTIGTTTLKGTGTSEYGFVARFDASGAPSWAKQVFLALRVPAIDEDMAVYVGGFAFGTTVLDGQTFGPVNGPLPTSYLLKIEAGQLTWAKPMGAATLLDVAVANGASLVATGSYDAAGGSIGGFVLPPTPTGGSFLAKIDGFGNITCAAAGPATTFPSPLAVAMTSRSLSLTNGPIPLFFVPE